MKKNTFKQIIAGFATSLGFWLFGQLLSGRLSFVEDIELYPAGYLVLFAPLAFSAVCILTAKYAVKNNKLPYFIATLVGLLIPIASTVIYDFLTHWAHIPAVSTLMFGFVLPSIPVFSILYQIQILPLLVSRWLFATLVVLPVVIGIGVAIKIVAGRKK